VVFRAIGHGAFGKVCEGLLYNNVMSGETATTPVAVKVTYRYTNFYSLWNILDFVVDVIVIEAIGANTAFSALMTYDK